MANLPRSCPPSSMTAPAAAVPAASPTPRLTPQDNLRAAKIHADQLGPRHLTTPTRFQENADTLPRQHVPQAMLAHARSNSASIRSHASR